MSTRMPAQISRETNGSLLVHVDSIVEPELLFKLCLEQKLAVQGYGSDLSTYWVRFNKDVDEVPLMMILRDRYELTIRR